MPNIQIIRRGHLRGLMFLANRAITKRGIPLRQRPLLLLAALAVLIDVIVIRLSFHQLNPNLLQKELDVCTKLGWLN